MKLYSELAPWWPLLSSPEEYAEEAAAYADLLRDSAEGEPESLLELGSGGGNNASHLKSHFTMTLVDRSPDMLAVSRALNPDCEHVEGDMRDVRLGRTFDAVFVHDAVVYMVTESDLRKAIETAFVHCAPGGAALFVPDHLHDTFEPSTSHGGHDGEDRSLRYLEWSWDPDPADTMVVVDYACLLREGEATRVLHDRHLEGLFARDQWLRFLAEAGFEAQGVPLGFDTEVFEAFACRKPSWAER